MRVNLSDCTRFEIAHIRTAKVYSELSRAIRLKVGAVLVSYDNKRPLLTGYNGTSSGACNTCEYEDDEGNLITKPDVHHAERNVICYAARLGIRTEGCILYVTHSPCIECAKEIELSGIVKVYYLNEYRDTSGADYLRNRGIEVIHIVE